MIESYTLRDKVMMEIDNKIAEICEKYNLSATYTRQAISLWMTVFFTEINKTENKKY